MLLKVLSFFLVTIPLFYCHNHVSQFECGAHGKFEYCIDDFPGCVIGCHCHPGYYFDTDSKICEPNIKLTLNRRYNAEPTRVYIEDYYATVAPPYVETPNAYNVLTNNVNDISKDTDDLGDWLYNQFFKTIENRIINNTQTDKPLTRRSGNNEPTNKEPVRITRKSSKSKSKRRKKQKARSLKKKLLHITEDDSLFGSDSDTDDSSDHSSSSDSSESDSSEASSSEEKPSKETPGKGDGKDHGHKKIILFNKRPKRPLPSFIFLPNVDTPFYPPMGLPPQPVMPMYPMAPIPPMMQPVPPMLPPFIVIPGSSKNATNGSSSGPTTVPPGTLVTSASHPSHQSTADSLPPTPSAPPNSTTAAPESLRRTKIKHQKQKLPPDPTESYLNQLKPSKSRKSSFGHRNKMLKKMREFLKNRRLNSPDDYYDEGAPAVDITGDILMSEETYTSPQMHRKAAERLFSQMPDVDFKYISELIHRANPKQPKKLPSISNGLKEDLEAQENIKASLSQQPYNPYRVEPASFASRREAKPPRQLQRSANDEYYTNLGRQIASMIRNADAKIVNQSIVAQESVRLSDPLLSVLNKNSLLSRSFWERSIRSPLNSISTVIDEYNAKYSPEINLFHLENEANAFTNTEPPLSLLDLENIINAMKAVKNANIFKSKNKISDTNASLNINLLPNILRKDDNTDPKYFKQPIIFKIVETTTAKFNHSKIFRRQDNDLDLEDWMFRVPSTIITPPTLREKSKEKMHDVTEPSTQPPKVKNASDLETHEHDYGGSQFVPKKHVAYLQFLRNMPLVKITKKKKDTRHLPRSDTVNYEHHYMFEEASYPLELSTYVRKKPIVTNGPSYFHHELHQFDYINNKK